MRLISLALFLIVICGCSGGIMKVAASKNYSNEMQYNREEKLVVSNMYGNVNVKAVLHAKSATVSAVLTTYSGTESAAQEFLDKIEIKFQHQGTDLVVETVVPKSWTLKGKARKPSEWSADIIVNLPEGLDVACEVTNGNVDVAGPNAGVIVQTINGEVSVSDNTDEITVVTTNGNTKVTNSQDYDIRVRQTTTNGNCTLDMPEAKYGWYVLKTTNGNISMNIPSAVEPEINMTSTNGNIDIILGEKISGSVDLKTKNGTVHTEMIINTSTTIDGIKTENQIKGKFNVGRGSVNAQTLNGNISLVYPDDYSGAVAEEPEPVEPTV